MKNKLVLLLAVVMLLSASIVTGATEILRPDGQGYYDAWHEYGCAYGWQCVDESTPVTSDRVYKGGANFKETFTFYNPQNIGANNNITRVTLYYYARNHIAGNKTSYKIYPMLRIYSNNYIGNLKYLTSTWSYYTNTWTTNPANNSQWTLNDINNLEAGMRNYPNLVAGGGRVAQVYAVVEYY